MRGERNQIQRVFKPDLTKRLAQQHISLQLQSGENMMKWRENGERREGGKYEDEGTRSDGRESGRARQMAEVI